MIQLIVLFPIIYIIIKKYGSLGVLIFGMINVLFEAAWRFFDCSGEIYRLCAMRYLLLIAFGCCLAIKQDSVFGKKTNIFVFAIGLLFIVMVEYAGIDPRIVNYSWKRVSYLAALYIMPVFEYIVLYKNEKYSPVVEKIGKASFNVFLVQMVFYQYFSNYYSIITDKTMVLLFSIIICAFVGIGFYEIENKIRNYRSIVSRRG